MSKDFDLTMVSLVSNPEPECVIKPDRTKELEQCRDEVRAVLSKSKAHLFVMSDGSLELFNSNESREYSIDASILEEF
jgi:hypothetical protein